MVSAAESNEDAGARLKLHDALFPLRGAEMRVELDKKTLFALASDTRVEILRTLVPMRRTVSQLSEALDIDKAAIHRHLKKMEEGGLVRRYEDHGFVYYGLSWKARDLMSPNENTRIVILFSASWIMCLAIVFLLAFALVGGAGHHYLTPSKGSNDGYANYENRTAPQESQYFQLNPASPLLIVSSGLIAMVAIVLAHGGFTGIRKPKQKQSPLDVVKGQD